MGRKRRIAARWGGKLALFHIADRVIDNRIELAIAGA
jgi:hypothetical protein